MTQKKTKRLEGQLTSYKSKMVSKLVDRGQSVSHTGLVIQRQRLRHRLVP